MEEREIFQTQTEKDPQDEILSVAQTVLEEYKEAFMELAK